MFFILVFPFNKQNLLELGNKKSLRLLYAISGTNMFIRGTTLITVFKNTVTLRNSNKFPAMITGQAVTAY